jgi:hypothetical protein
MFRVYIHLQAEVGGRGRGGDNSSNLLVKDTQQPTNHSFAPGFCWTDSFVFLLNICNTGMGSLLTVLKPQKWYRAFLEGGVPLKLDLKLFRHSFHLIGPGRLSLISTNKKCSASTFKETVSRFRIQIF